MRGRGRRQGREGGEEVRKGEVEAAGGRAVRERSDGGSGREVEGVRVGGWERWRET
jgi:hypothetical protein